MIKIKELSLREKAEAIVKIMGEDTAAGTGGLYNFFSEKVVNEFETEEDQTYFLLGFVEGIKTFQRILESIPGNEEYFQKTKKEIRYAK